MKKKIIKSIIGIAAVCFAGMASAQLGGLGSALGGLGGKSGGGGISAEGLVKTYVSGTKNVLNADSKFLDALGLKDQSANAALQAKNLTEGATSSNLEDAAKVQTENSKILASQLDGKKVELDAAGKKKFTSGLVDLASGIKDYANVSSSASGFKPSLTSIGGSAGAALFIVKSLPDTTINLMSTLKRAVGFAQENNIEVPKEATSLL